jgi:hypothetical protein
MTPSANKTLRAALQDSLIGPISVALLLAAGVNAIIKATQPAVGMLLFLLINRIISQAHLDATPLPTRIIWGDSVNLGLTAIAAIWLGVVLSLWLFSNPKQASPNEDAAK